VEWLGPQVSVDEVTGRLTTLAHYEPIVRRLEAELRGVQRLGEQLNRYFGEIDQEMRLAGRLQRDLLPHDVNDTSPIVFSTVYRPASWVSGDIYDLFRIDEHHLGMFIADAMGHGVAAGLMTMFLKQGLVPRQRDGKTLRIVSPAEALGNLHESLCRHQLPSCQFVTAAYAIIDTRSLDLCVARAGHPFPLHIAGASGDVRELDPGGGLLGIPDVDPEFEEVRTVLAPGDKFMLYTDGIEDVIVAPRVSHAAPTCFTPTFHEWAAKPAVELSAAVDDHLDHREGSLHPPDDITLLTLEVVRNS
jgi:sigma-B regulation protein RsbU (phosphoserine phosphatase)